MKSKIQPVSLLVSLLQDSFHRVNAFVLHKETFLTLCKDEGKKKSLPGYSGFFQATCRYQGVGAR